MEKSEKVLWDKCFESMSEDEYCSTTLGKLNDIFKEYLIAKATAYDRVMSMNSLSKNDIKIVLDGNAWCAYRLPFRNLQEDDAGFGATPQIALTALLESELPDGWEEK